VIGGWRKLYNEELHNLYSSPDIIRIIKSRMMRTYDRPDLSSEGAPDIDKTVTVKQQLTSGHEPQTGLETKTH
jgi:hypothetical protein